MGGIFANPMKMLNPKYALKEGVSKIKNPVAKAYEKPTKLSNEGTAATNKGLAGIGGAMYSTKTGVI